MARACWPRAMTAARTHRRRASRSGRHSSQAPAIVGGDRSRSSVRRRRHVRQRFAVAKGRRDRTSRSSSNGARQAHPVTWLAVHQPGTDPTILDHDLGRGGDGQWVALGTTDDRASSTSTGPSGSKPAKPEDTARSRRRSARTIAGVAPDDRRSSSRRAIRRRHGRLSVSTRRPVLGPPREAGRPVVLRRLGRPTVAATIRRMTRDPHRPLREAWIVEAVRTPIGRYGGALASVRPDDLAAAVLRAVVDRAGVDPALVEDVILGCANQAGEDNRNVARMALLLADFPVEVGGLTVNRLCGSGLQAINSAAHAIAVGDGDVFIGGGVESMTRAPYVQLKAEGPGTAARARWPTRPSAGGSSTRAWPSATTRTRWARPPRTSPSAGASRASARTRSRSRASSAPSPPSRPAGSPTRSSRSASRSARATRSSSTATSTRAPTRPLEALARLRPAFRPEGGTVTAGNSSGINDGASAVLLVEADRARELGLRPLARVVSTAVAGVDPAVMGVGPVPATRKALERAGLGVDDLDLIELNEAFASQSLVCIDELGLDPAKVNVNGGAIALGHPLGMSGGRLITMLDPRAAPDRRPLRPRHDVHRRRPGDRDDRRAPRRLSPTGTQSFGADACRNPLRCVRCRGTGTPAPPTAHTSTHSRRIQPDDRPAADDGRPSPWPPRPWSP